jgi:hypothetical protein
MNLAITAAPYPQNKNEAIKESNIKNNEYIFKSTKNEIKGNNHKFNHTNNNGISDKVSNVLKEIYEDGNEESTINQTMPTSTFEQDFTPPPYAVSTAENKQVPNNYVNNNANEEVSFPVTSETGDELSYKKFMTQYMNQIQNNKQGTQHIQHNNVITDSGADTHAPNNNEILLKLTKILQLLEENRNVKTDNVNEEVILYSFLGIFMIFIADAFVRIGKYVR